MWIYSSRPYNSEKCEICFLKVMSIRAMPNSRESLLQPNLLVVNNKKTLVVLLLQNLSDRMLAFVKIRTTLDLLIHCNVFSKSRSAWTWSTTGTATIRKKQFYTPASCRVLGIGIWRKVQCNLANIWPVFSFF